MLNAKKEEKKSIRARTHTHTYNTAHKFDWIVNKIEKFCRRPSKEEKKRKKKRNCGEKRGFPLQTSTRYANKQQLNGTVQMKEKARDDKKRSLAFYVRTCGLSVVAFFFKWKS